METLTAAIIEFLKGQSLQVAIVFVGVLILTWLLRNKSAHIRYLLWLLVAIKCLTPPLVIFSVPVLPAETIPVIVPTQRPSVEQKQPSVTLNQTFSEEISVAPDKPRLTPQYSIENLSPRDRKFSYNSSSSDFNRHSFVRMGGGRSLLSVVGRGKGNSTPGVVKTKSSPRRAADGRGN